MWQHRLWSKDCPWSKRPWAVVGPSPKGDASRWWCSMQRQHRLLRRRRVETPPADGSLRLLCHYRGHGTLLKARSNVLSFNNVFTRTLFSKENRVRKGRFSEHPRRYGKFHSLSVGLLVKPGATDYPYRGRARLAPMSLWLQAIMT